MDIRDNGLALSSIDGTGIQCRMLLEPALHVTEHVMHRLSAMTAQACCVQGVAIKVSNSSNVELRDNGLAVSSVAGTSIVCRMLV